MENVLGAVDVALETFGGLVLGLGPSDIPEGASPSNNDVVFSPGSVASRPCLSALFSPPISGNPTVTYNKTYVQPNEDPLTLLLDSSGGLWSEDVENNPGILSSIATVQPGMYANSISAFGREYIAFNDGHHGSDIPRQFDGTNFDRVSQDGVGAGPTATNFLPSSVTIAASGGGVTVNIITASVSDPYSVSRGPFLPPLTLYKYRDFVVDAPSGLAVGDFATTSGMTPSAPYTGSAPVQVVVSPTEFKLQYGGEFAAPATGGTVTGGFTASSMIRQNNVVTAQTSTPHGFQPGWRVTISGIAQNNLAAIASISRVAATGVVTVTMSSAVALPVGATIAIAGVTDSSFDGIFPIATVISGTEFTYSQGGVDATSSAGNVQDVWNGTFMISTVTSQSFTYSQLGADDSTTDTGTATINGQISPGARSVVIMFQTRQGYITKPSPPVSFNANGGQQIQVSNLPIGPDNVVARIVAFTLAGGNNYFYIATSVTQGGVIVTNSTVVADNTTTSAIFDFSDNALAAATAIDIPGNNLFALVVLGPCLGFFQYASRLWAWGERNKIQNFLNMAFDGGHYSGSTDPLGWEVVTGGGELVTTGVFGQAWRITGTFAGTPRGELAQGAFQDYLGIAILEPDTQYFTRTWLKRTGTASGSFLIVLDSATDGEIARVTIPLSAISTSGSYIEAAFDNKTGLVIPADAELQIYTENMLPDCQVTIDELELIFTEDPFTDTIFRGSYVLNPESFDGVTGTLGALGDDSPIRCAFDQRNNFYFHTANTLQVTADNGNGEPSTWSVQEQAKVGALSSRSSAPSATGEGWQFTASRGGLYIFSGGEPIKISQEIQSDATGTCWDSIALDAAQSIWVTNDVVARRVFVAVPIGEATAPDVIFVMDYRYLDSANEIAAANPLRSGGTSLSSGELTRKWTLWNVLANCGEMLRRQGNIQTFVVGSGDGADPNVGSGFGNSYLFDPAKFVDDDYGAMTPSYYTYFFVNMEKSLALGLGAHRKLARYLTMSVTGFGTVTVTPYVASLSNAWPSTPALDMAANRAFDTEIGLNVLGERIAFKLSFSPPAGSQEVQFELQNFCPAFVQDPWSPIRGAI